MISCPTVCTFYDRHQSDELYIKSALEQWFHSLQLIDRQWAGLVPTSPAHSCPQCYDENAVARGFPRFQSFIHFYV